ncbi:AMP-binding protein [Sphingobium sp. EM0848]|uniref:AMP-binding protein n=1 Tax=Sphingobium sp. EM0848 TaxID=2743473 RepID=UPI00159C0C22|nr:AMP-binding protein [Sphingobium sp. EM0848]
MSKDELTRYHTLGALTDETLIGAYRRTFAQYPDRVALSRPGSTVSFAELDDITNRGAAALWRLGLRPTDRVIFQMRNCKELVYAFLSCLKIGVIPVCTLAAHREQEIGYIGNHAGAKAHFVHGDDGRFDMVAFAKSIAARIPSIAHILVVRSDAPAADTLSFENLITAEDSAAARKLVEGMSLDPYQVAVFQLSGGTSGIPKIIPRFSNEYLYAMRSVTDHMGITRETVTFTANPFMHNAPMACFWGPTLLAGGEMVIADGPSLADIEAALTARRPNWIALAKVHLMRLIENGVTDRLTFDNVRAFSVPDSARQLSRMLGAPCIPMYGMTEGLLGFALPSDPGETVEFTVGRSTSPHDEIRIVRPGSEDDLPDGEVGELLVRGPCTIRGYFDAPDRDVEAFTADGFYRSGDLMSWRTVEGVRNLVFNGRVKDVIDRGGEKINCSEVELAISRHPSVGAVACVAMPDPLYGERMCAFIALRDQAPELTLTTLGTHLAEEGLSKFKWPERIELVPELPSTTSGKVSKPLMREIIAAKLKAEASGQSVVG